MKIFQHTKLLSIALWLSCLTVHAQPTPTREDILTDLKVFADSLPLLHKNLYARLTKAEFDESIEAIRKKENLDYASFAIELMRLAARTGDEHMDIRASQPTLFPFRYDLIDGSVVIVASFNGNPEWLSHKVMAINDVPMEDIRKTFAQLTDQKNKSFADFAFIRQLNRPMLLNSLGIVKGALTVFTLSSPSGEIVKAMIQPMGTSEISKMLPAESLKGLLMYQEPNAYGFQYLPDTKTVYFNYKSCSERKDWPFADFNQKLFEAIEKEKPEKLILDLRQNSGGNSAILAPFIKSIRKSYLNKSKQFYVLIGRPVFSSAVMNAVELKRTTDATFVGEETAGNINHYGEVKSLRLPRTGIRVTYSTKYWETWKGNDGGLKPDAGVLLTYEDFLKGRDPVLEYALNR